jgi:multimeric flavodoxin WrbA
MKLVCLLGSPRREGNSATVAALLTARARELGAETETVYLNGLTMKGCQGCYACKTGADRCVVADDLAPVLESVRTADALVLATPVYYGDVTAQLKCFIDRTFSYLVPDYATNPVRSRLAPGKRLAFVIVQGHPDEKLFADIYPRYELFFRWLGFTDNQLVRWCGLQEKSDVLKRTELIELAERTAEQLVRGG